MSPTRSSLLNSCSKIAALEDSLEVGVNPESRLRELSAVCRDAAALEAARAANGQPESSQAPWPESTVRFLREQARRHHG